jgi:DNA-binding NarL/FixJ family response regulator
VVCEALANIAKHAHARSGTVAIERVDGRLVVEVHDDGDGGADLESGTGLRGLADRVGALDGRLTIASPPGGDDDPGGDPVRVLIADDSALVRDGLRHLLPRHGFEIAGAVADLRALLEAVERAQPDVALIDIRMPPTHTTEGVTAATTIRQDHHGVGVILLSQHVDADYALTLLRHEPARCGYLLKDRITDIGVLTDAIGRVAGGETVVDAELVDLLLHRSATRDRLGELTARECEVLELLAQGLTDRGIGERLWLTPKTVETHVRHILAKLDLPNDTQHNRRVLAVLTYLREGRQATVT